jgi:hypothetical protein
MRAFPRLPRSRTLTPSYSASSAMRRPTVEKSLPDGGWNVLDDSLHHRIASR